MIVDDLLKQSTYWLPARGGGGVVISSRTRLARNVHGAAFPGWAGDDERRKLFDRICKELLSLKSMGDAAVFGMEALAPSAREILVERRLVSEELSEKGVGSGLVLSEKNRLAIMVNEEDHLRLQAMRPGMHLAATWRAVDRIDRKLEKRLHYSFSPRLGYLTACPSNVGTGLRASVMMHLPGLKLQNEMDQVACGLNRLGFIVRGAFGEGSDAYGNMFQVSNQTTLGEEESEIIARLERVVGDVVAQEMNARGRLMEQQRIHVLDYVSRAIGILQHARVISSGEAMDLLSGLRLGTDFGILMGVTVTKLNELMLVTQPAHLQKVAGRELSAAERDEYRADLMRERLKGVSMARQYR